MTITLHSLAKEMSLAFEGDTRTNGETFRKLREGSPEWMTTVCRQAHDQAKLLPDDWRYAFIEDAVDVLAEHEDIDEALGRLEPDIYTGRLTAWLSSLNSRVYYLNEVLTEYGTACDGFQLLAAAQMIEKEEVFHQVVAALEAVVTTFDDTNRRGMYEACSLTELHAEWAQTEEAEKQELAARDAREKATGMTVRITAWIHPHSGGDDYLVDWYFAEQPTPSQIRSLLREQGSMELDDFTLIHL